MLRFVLGTGYSDCLRCQSTCWSPLISFFVSTDGELQVRVDVVVETGRFSEKVALKGDKCDHGGVICEYDLFVELTDNEFVPSFMIINTPPDSPDPKLFAPERDFDEIDDGIKIIKKELGKK